MIVKFSQTMPVINIDDLTDLDKAKMEVTQLKLEVQLDRAKVRLGMFNSTNYAELTIS